MIQEHVDMVSWTVGRGRTVGPAPFFVVGILNVTPDSFYDGGACVQTEHAVARGIALLEQGAHVLDVGGESTRPFAAAVSLAEERDRVVPVVRELCDRAPEAFVSIDTTKAAVAQACLEAGACIVNDVSAWNREPHLLDIVCQYAPGYVLMHSQGAPDQMQLAPRYDNVIDDICAFFESHLGTLVSAGLPEDHIVLDPGIGFGKTLDHNLEILRNIARLHRFGRPLYMGLSNKSLWGQLLGRDVHERAAATVAATALLFGRGVRIHRVHAVRETCDALNVAQALGGGRGENL